MFSSCFHPSRIDKDSYTSKLETKHVVNKALFRLTFNKRVKSDQLAGLPPMTFFSQSSESVYSSSHSLRLSVPKRR